MASITINGREYPLCLTVAALDDLKSRGYGLRDISKIVQPAEGESVDDVAERTVWMLSILIREGEMHRCILAGEGRAQSVPGYDLLARIMTPGRAMASLGIVIQAITESMHQEIEAAPPKNADRAGLA